MTRLLAACFIVLTWLPPAFARAAFDVQGLYLGMTAADVVRWGRDTWTGKMSAEEHWDAKERIAAEAHFHNQNIPYHGSTAITMYRKEKGQPLIRHELARTIYFIERSTVPARFAVTVEPCEVSRGACLEVEFRSNNRVGRIESLQYLAGGTAQLTEDRLIEKYGKPSKVSKAAGVKFFAWGPPGDRRNDGGQARYFYPLEAQIFWIDTEILLQVTLADRSADGPEKPPPASGPRL